MEKYKENKDIAMKESLQLSAEVRKACGQEIFLVCVRDHKKNTLNLAISSRNKVVEMRLNLDSYTISDPAP